MALSKVNAAVAGLVNETQTNTVNSLSEFLKGKLAAEYDGDITADIERMIEEFKTHNMKPVEVTTTKGKKAKDPNAPKRAPTAYNRFVAEHIGKLKEANPTMKGKELMEEVGKLWKQQKASGSSEPSEEESNSDDEPVAAPAAGKGKGKGKA